MSAPITEAHRDLVLRVRVCDMHYGIEPASKLIADSEVAATERLRKEIDWLQLNNDMLTDNPVGHARAVKERADLIAERDRYHDQMNEWKANATASWDELGQLRQQVANLTYSNNSHRETAETWRAAAVERDQLRAEVEQWRRATKYYSVALVETGVTALRTRAEAGEASLHAELTALREGNAGLSAQSAKDALRVGELEAELAKLRASFAVRCAEADRNTITRQTAELAKERARLDWLMNKSFLVMPSATGFAEPFRYAVYIYDGDGDLRQQYPSADTERAAIDAAIASSAMKEDSK